MRIYEDLRAVHQRLLLMQYGLAVAAAVLLGQFYYLQVLRGRQFRELAENNRIRTIELAAPRGPLLDRNGRVLVGNRPSFNVLVDPELSDDLDRTVVRLAELLHTGEAALREQLARRGAPYQRVVVRTNASFEEVAALEARRLELPEVSVSVVPLRSYALASAAAHSLGRVGEVTDRQLRLPEYASHQPGDLVGQAGLEARYDEQLTGTKGRRQVVVNSRGIEVGELEERPYVQGPSLGLTLDAGLQSFIERAFAGHSGSAVALDPRTGALLALASLPAYDPNAFIEGIDPVAWGRLRTDPRTPLMNRAIQGQYAPGSVFKIVMAAAALEEGIVTPETTFTCRGSLYLYDNAFGCTGHHGPVNLKQALAQSCNVYFYQLGVRLDIARIARYAERMGFGAPTGVDLPHEISGLVPSPEWKRRALGQNWFAGETVSVSIGQGQLTVTPLQVARLAALVANGGHLVHPYLGQTVGGRPIERPEPRDLGFAPSTWEAIREGMWASVNAGGTGRRAALPGIAVCGKTGSSQVVARARLRAAGDNAALQPHAWFAGFAPRRNPRIALSVLIENGGSGGAAAAPVARQILERFFRFEPAPETQAAQAGAAPADAGQDEGPPASAKRADSAHRQRVSGVDGEG
jgi:penicillin-binding protein 2